MNSKDAFCADSKSGTRGARDGWGMRYRRSVLYSQGEKLDRVRRRALCSSDGEKINAFRTSAWCAAQGGGAIVIRYKCHTSRQAAGVAERRFRHRTPSRNRKCIGCSHDKSSVVHARDAGRSCDGEGEILCPCRGDPVGRCECESIVSE